MIWENSEKSQKAIPQTSKAQTPHRWLHMLLWFNNIKLGSATVKAKRNTALLDRCLRKPTTETRCITCPEINYCKTCPARPHLHCDHQSQQPHLIPWNLYCITGLTLIKGLNYRTSCAVSKHPTWNNHIRPPISASSLRRIRSSQCHDLFMPRVRTTMAHTRSFASISPSLRNPLPPPFRSLILSAPLS